MALLKQIFNVDSFATAHEQAKTLDNAGGVILARNLEHVSSEVFEQKFAGLTLLNQGITVNNEGGYADIITKLKEGVSGDFQVSGGGDNTDGKISLVGASDGIPVLYKEGFSEWNENELKQAELEGRNLVTSYVRAHNSLYQRNIDKIGYIGQTGKTTGLLNHAGFTATGATGVFSGLTATAMYDEVATLITSQWTGVYNEPTFMANRVVMPQAQYNLLSLKVLNSAAGPQTVLQALKLNFPTVSFEITNEATLVSGSARMVAYSNDRQAMQLRIPVPLTVSPIFQHGFKFQMQAYFRIGGLDVIENGAGKILTGI
jgi:hypothetical protein